MLNNNPAYNISMPFNCYVSEDIRILHSFKNLFIFIKAETVNVVSAFLLHRENLIKP